MSRPTIVLVHGAFGDASSWRGVFDLLDGGEYALRAAALPLRGVASDVAYLGAVIDQLDGPVVLVGHSYAGCVITDAGVSDRVTALVYDNAFMPDAGESITDLQTRFPSLIMGNFLQSRQLPDGSVELSVEPERFQSIFCADVPDDVAAFMAHAQRPLAARVFDERAVAAAWRTRPSWAVFGTGDHPIAVELQRFTYGRAGSTLTEIEGASHFSMVSHPEIVAGVIRERRDGVRGERGRMTPPISRGFRGRRSEASDAGRVPPGQYVTHDFPVLSAGPTPHLPIDAWSFEIRGDVDEPRSWTWEQFSALPSERITVDIHCVTKWSKLDTTWRGVSLDTLLDGIDTNAEYLLAFSDGGYS
ncbi:MAG: hypothetical protein QOE10_2906, partial [Gaiellales bacterium]|nr:hypothetical protein [Gaiellales bacterium]